MLNPQISIIAPLYNETESFPRLIKRLNAIMDTSPHAIKVVSIDGGSRDNTAVLMQQLALTDSRYHFFQSKGRPFYVVRDIIREKQR
ncbi:glycosyltransferase [Spirosoma pulveris]